MAEDAETYEQQSRPGINDETAAYVRYWWDASGETPEFADVRKQMDADDHDLFPGEERRKRRNTQNECMRTKEDSRIVQNAHIFKASQQMVAMTIPPEWSFEFKQRKNLLSMRRQDQETEQSQMLDQLGATITELVNMHLEECKGRDVLEDVVRDGCSYRAGILKVWHQYDYQTDPLSRNRLPDMQDEIAELESLKRDYAAGRFAKTDGKYQRMRSMELGMAKETHLRIWSGICMETVSMRAFRIDPRITSVDAFHNAKWMAEDLVMSRRDILARFPYEPDEDSPHGFTGVHEDDLASGTAGTSDTDDLVEKERERRAVSGNWSKGRTTREDSQTGTGIEQDEELHLVRQLWIRDEGKVLILINGVDYPVAEWYPENTPACWYPYHALVLNRTSKSWFGKSNTELASDEQARINQKDTDDEKARWLAMERGVYDKGAINEEEAIKLADIGPGEYRGVDFQGRDVNQILMKFGGTYNPILTDSSNNSQRMDKMHGTTSAALGQFQTANFATELDLAARGVDIMTQAQQATVRRWLEQVLVAIAETLLQVTDEDEAELWVGENAYLPRFYSDADAVKAVAAVQAAVVTQVDQMMAEAQAMIAEGIPQEEVMAEFAGIENPQALAQELYQQIALEAWGALEPMTRESLFKRLQIDIDTTPDARMQARQNMADLTNSAALLQNSGRQLSTRALSNILGQMLGIKDDLDDLLTIDAGASLQELMSAIQEQGLAALGEQGVAMLASLGLVAQQAMMQAAEQQGQMQARQQAQAAVAEDEEAEALGLTGMEEEAPAATAGLAG